jgi:hypothetical protein
VNFLTLSEALVRVAISASNVPVVCSSLILRANEERVSSRIVNTASLTATKPKVSPAEALIGRELGVADDLAEPPPAMLARYEMLIRKSRRKNAARTVRLLRSR